MSAAHLSDPPLCEEGHVLVVSHCFPPHGGGSSVSMHNLLDGFARDSFTVAAAHPPAGEPHEDLAPRNVRHLGWRNPGPARVEMLWRDAMQPLVAARLASLCRSLRPALVLAVYPELHFFEAAFWVARALKLPFVAYLHDTLSEGLARGRYARRGKRLEQQLLRHANRVLVMSDGMRALYRRKHGRDFEPIRHTYREPIDGVAEREGTEPQAFWSGAVYSINHRAVLRVANAVAGAGLRLHLTVSANRAQLARLGLSGRHITTGFFGTRSGYLQALRAQRLLVLALDAPDESPVHEDELATIFPTKTPEYLASGRPILVHCPEHYYLARFFREHEAGLVVSDRSPEALGEAIEALARDGRRYSERSLAAAKLFDHAPVQSRLSQVLSEVVRSCPQP